MDRLRQIFVSISSGSCVTAAVKLRVPWLSWFQQFVQSDCWFRKDKRCWWAASLVLIIWRRHFSRVSNFSALKMSSLFQEPHLSALFDGYKNQWLVNIYIELGCFCQNTTLWSTPGVTLIIWSFKLLHVLHIWCHQIIKVTWWHHVWESFSRRFYPPRKCLHA